MDGAGFSCRRQEICFAGLASRGYGNLMLTLEQQAACVGEGARDFPPDSWRLGKDGTHAYSPGGGERGCTQGALRTAWKLRIDKNAKTSRKNPHVAERRE